MRALYCSVEDARDVLSWSGTPYFMSQAMAAAKVELSYASPLRERYQLSLRAAQVVRNRLGKTSYSRLREPLVLNAYARQVEKAWSRHSPDLIVSPSSLPVSELSPGPPVVLWTDCTFENMEDFYPSYANISTRYRRLGHHMEARALGRCQLAVFSSEWAARSAIDHYGLSPDKVAVVPFGANMTNDPGEHVLEPATARSPTCRLLSIGRGWHRKGVDLAVQTTASLRRAGIPATLDVVGSAPPAGVSVPKYVRVHGSIEKDTAAGTRRIDALYRASHFFVLPTRADCTPIVLAEAQAYSLPVVSTRVGGVASMISEGTGGYSFDLDSFVDQAAYRIGAAWTQQDAYVLLRKGSRAHYQNVLNWATATGEILRLVKDRVGILT